MEKWQREANEATAALLAAQIASPRRSRLGRLPREPQWDHNHVGACDFFKP